ncbi:glutaminyl-peptide cyclotransferase [Proteobacteria bacterium 005FR1]|nr:glutaminyl-peptide cyclotransferase [Proteobacteria bacterium 005FR1]
MAITSLRSWTLAVVLLASACSAVSTEQLSYEVLAREDHDPEIFTQGLALDGDNFFESSGHYGRSFLLRYPRNGGDNQRLALPRTIFAEGIEVVGDRLYLLSWKSGKAWALDKNTFEVEKEFRYEGEGWGLTHDGQRLILSDGTDRLRFYDENFQLLGSRRVHLDGESLRWLNELEYQGGLVWANQWHSDTIYAIDPDSGAVIATVDLAALRPEAAGRSRESVLNGIAWDQAREGFWITGKYWRYRYLVRFDALDTDLGG